MKKRLVFALLLALALLALCACSGQSAPATTDDNPAPADAQPETETADAAPESAPAITMRGLLDANRGETLFSTYSGLLKTYQYPDDNPDAWRRVSEYHNADALLMDYGAEQDLLPRDGSNVYFHDDKGYAAVLEFDFDPSYYAFPLLDEALTLQEEIVSVTEDADAGTIALTTRLSADAYQPFYPEGEFPYDDGDFFEEHYLLNASDYAILETASALVHADGSREEQSRVAVAYDAAEPEILADLLARKNAEDFRTGTVTLDPNTPEERSASAKAQKGDAIVTMLPDGYDTLYLDPECVTPQDPDAAPDYNADFHLYAKRAE